jgi:hypothetical protein
MPHRTVGQDPYSTAFLANNSQVIPMAFGDGVTADHLCRSHWLSPRSLLGMRVLFALWTLGFWIWLWVPSRDHNPLPLPSPCFLTIQSFTLICFYFWVTVLHSRREWNRAPALSAGSNSLTPGYNPLLLNPLDDESRLPTSPPVDWLGKLQLALFELLAPTAFLVSIVFWVIIYPTVRIPLVLLNLSTYSVINFRSLPLYFCPQSHAPILWVELHAHGLNSLAMFCEVFFNTTPLFAWHVFFIVGYSATYLGFCWIVFAYTKKWPYTFIDPAKGNVIVHYAMLTALAIFLFYTVFGLVKLRDRSCQVLKRVLLTRLRQGFFFHPIV